MIRHGELLPGTICFEAHRAPFALSSGGPIFGFLLFYEFVRATFFFAHTTLTMPWPSCRPCTHAFGCPGHREGRAHTHSDALAIIKTVHTAFSDALAIMKAVHTAFSDALAIMKAVHTAFSDALAIMKTVHTTFSDGLATMKAVHTRFQMSWPS